MPLSQDERINKLADDLVGTLNKLFGDHPGFRAAHARGVLLTGTFTPTPEAAKLSSAPHFNALSTPVTARFSSSTGLPKIPDDDPNAEPRGFAVRFELGARAHTDIIAHSTNAFPTRTGDEFLEMFAAIGASPPGTPSPTPIERFLGAHPAALAFVTTPKPHPASFASQAYFALNAFKFVDADGAARFVRYTWEPKAGVAHLDAAQGADYLFDELAVRLARAPVAFELWAQLAADGDPTDDVTVHWPAERERVLLGAVTLDALAPDNAAASKHIIFDPIPRVQGVEASEDPILETRAAVYLISGRKRRAAPALEA